MTSKEAIDNLRSLRELAIGFVFEDSPKIAALDLAIKALEREETCRNKLDDRCPFFDCSACDIRATKGNDVFNYCPNCGRRVEK